MFYPVPVKSKKISFFTSEVNQIEDVTGSFSYNREVFSNKALTELNSGHSSICSASSNSKFEIPVLTSGVGLSAFPKLCTLRLSLPLRGTLPRGIFPPAPLSTLLKLWAVGWMCGSSLLDVEIIPSPRRDDPHIYRWHGAKAPASRSRRAARPRSDYSAETWSAWDGLHRAVLPRIPRIRGISGRHSLLRVSRCSTSGQTG